ncbi:MAG: hypothetical protein KatS3mg050_4510 [Litorilinea sp.]|nr:MAG: hypothetical protein KatS3mg050_4510 [Litorilinea sp.]
MGNGLALLTDAAVAGQGVPRIRRLLLGLAAVGLALWAQQRLTAGNLVDAGVLYAAAGFLFVTAIPLPRWPAGLPLTAASTPMAFSFRQWAVLALAVLMSLLSLATLDFYRPAPVAWLLHGASIGLCLAPFLDWRRLHPRRWPWHELLSPHGALLLAVLGVALFMRLYRFQSWPFGTWFDEAEAGLQALRILEDPNYRPLFVDSINVTSHYLHLVALSFQLFGVSTQSIRLVSVAMGLGTVVAGYLVGRELFGRSMGLVLAFLLAVSRWDVTFSRIGMYNASTPLFSLLTFAFFLRGLRRRSLWDFALAGVWLGLGLWFYPAFQLFVAALALLILLLSLTGEPARGRRWPRWVSQWLQSYWRGLLTLALAALLVVAPLARFVYQDPDTYFRRARTTALFENVAPEARLPALWSNVRKHLLMFHYRGDPNGRHNLPGAPMLDPYSAALMLLGLALAVVGCRRGGVAGALALFLPLWLLTGLLGGILSLDFEAPQSLRSIGALPPAYILAALPLAALAQEWRRVGEPYLPGALNWPLGLLLAAVGFSNFHTYFFLQAGNFASWNAYSTPETIAAQILNQATPGTEAYVISLFQGHPTLRFLTRPEVQGSRLVASLGEAVAVRKLETNDQLPIQTPADHPVLLILDADRQALFDEARRLYPQAQFREHRPPFGGPTVVYEVQLTPQDLASIQGLTGRYYRGTDWQGEPVLERQDSQLHFDWRPAPQGSPPLDGPFSVEWEGVLRVDTYGPHRFFLQAPGHAELYIGEERILAGEGNLAGGVVLAQGNHALRVRAVGAAGSFSLSWQTPTRGPEIIPPWSLYVPPVTSNGLLGRYFPNGQWQPPEALAQIDPRLQLYFHNPVLPRPYTVEWTGKIAIPASGPYVFGLESIDESVLYIDGQEVTSSLRRNEYQEGLIQLEAGLHDIRIRYADRTDHTHINLYWQPPTPTGTDSTAQGPSRRRQIVPPAVLFPPQASYDRVELPALSQFIFDQGAPGLPQLPSLAVPRLSGQLRVVATGLAAPRGIGVEPLPETESRQEPAGPGRIYVAEGGSPGQPPALRILSPDGETLALVTEGAEPLVEPADVAVDAAGQVYLLDAGRGALDVFGPDGTYLRTLPVEASLLNRSRGLAVDAAGRIWVANTPGARLVVLDDQGNVLALVPVWPDPAGPDAQPVDVAVGNHQDLLVTDVGLHKLIRLGAAVGEGSEGLPPLGVRRLMAWDRPPANSLDGPHLAATSEAFYRTDPEGGRVEKLGPDGELVGVWQLAELPGAADLTGGRPVKPVGIAADPSGRLWIADSEGGHVLLLAPTP